jgi:cytochrome c oxidase cbb3-type subunit 4
MDYMGVIQSIWTVVAMVIFISIGLWAWSGRRKDEFDDAANLPLDLPVKRTETKDSAKQEES